MEYKPKQEDIAFAKDVYDRIIFTQVLNPFAVKEAFKKLFGYDAVSAQQAKIKVSAYFIYTYKAVDVTETAVPENSTSISTDTSTQSHSEDVGRYDDDTEVINTTYVGIAEDTELQKLERAYELADNANQKRSIKYKINKLKKQADGND